MSVLFAATYPERRSALVHRIGTYAKRPGRRTIRGGDARGATRVLDEIGKEWGNGATLDERARAPTGDGVREGVRVPRAGREPGRGTT